MDHEDVQDGPGWTILHQFYKWQCFGLLVCTSSAGESNENQNIWILPSPKYCILLIKGGRPKGKGDDERIVTNDGNADKPDRTKPLDFSNKLCCFLSCSLRHVIHFRKVLIWFYWPGWLLYGHERFVISIAVVTEQIQQLSVHQTINLITDRVSHWLWHYTVSLHTPSLSCSTLKLQIKS